MSTYPPNLAQSFLTVCEIITFQVDKKAFFPFAKGGKQSLKGPENNFFE
jgi:hypothetical protein